MNIGAVSVVEVADSRGGSVGKDGSQVMTFIVAWASLADCLRALTPGWTKIDDTTWKYSAGFQHPNFPEQYCETATWKAEGMPNSSGSWDQARIVATFKPLPFDPNSADPADIFEEELDFSVEQMTYPSKSLKKDGSSSEDDKITTFATKLIPVCHYTLTLIDVPTLPGGNTDLIFSLLGKINSSAVKGAAVKCALFLGANTSRTTTNVGTKGWRIALKFAVRPVGLEWTKVFHEKDGTFVEAVTVNGGNPIYDSDNLNNLLPKA